MIDKSATPLVSVVIASYNSAFFIRDCLNAIISQTYKNIEIVVVDDGSVDNTVEIIRTEYESKVRLIAQTNQKVASARHNGILHCTGPYIAFCDHDDLWLPDKIEKQVAVFENNPACCLVHSDAEELHVSTGAKALYSKLHPHIKDQSVILSHMIRDFAVPLFSTVMVRIAFLKENGIQFTDVPPGVDDLGVFLLIILNGGTFVYMDEPLVVRRMHASNQSSDYLLRFQRRIALYTYLLINRRQNADKIYLRQIRWGLADAAYRVADSACEEYDVGELMRLYQVAWKNNKWNLKALIKLIILVLGGRSLFFAVKK